MARAYAARDNGGFSLVEVLIAMGIATFIIVISTGVHISNLRYFRTTEGRTNIYQDAILISEFFRNELMAAGGGSVRGWMGLWVEDNCNARAPLPGCAGSDRVTISSVTVPLQECPITGQLGGGRVQVAFTSPGICCMQPQAADEKTYLDKNVMVTLGDYTAQYYVRAVNLQFCQADLVPGQAYGGSNLPPAPAVPPYNWTNGTMSMISVETFYWDSAANTLKRFIDKNNDGAPQSDEDVVVADNIFDLQFALGYDFNLADGNINETANGASDEWLYNNPSAVETYGAGYFVAPITRSALQMVMFGVIVGYPDTTLSLTNTPIRSLNGPLRSRAGWILQEESSRLAPRNAFIFQ